MKTKREKTGTELKQILTLVSIFTLLLLSAQTFAQVVRDNDLIYKDNPQWYAQGLFWSVIIVLLIVLITVFWRRRGGKNTNS